MSERVIVTPPPTDEEVAAIVAAIAVVRSRSVAIEVDSVPEETPWQRAAHLERLRPSDT